MQSPAFLTSTLANYLALIFRRLSGEGRTEVGENGQNSEDVGLQTPSKLQALSFYYVLVGGSVSSDWKRHKITDHDAKKHTVSYLYSCFLHYINIWDQKVQNAVFYEAFLPITWIKSSAGFTKYSKCMGSNVARDITIPLAIRMVRCAEMAARWTGDYVTSMLVFRAEKRSVQASAHPLSQA